MLYNCAALPPYHRSGNCEIFGLFAVFAKLFTNNQRAESVQAIYAGVPLAAKGVTDDPVRMIACNPTQLE